MAPHFLLDKVQTPQSEICFFNILTSLSSLFLSLLRLHPSQSYQPDPSYEFLEDTALLGVCFCTSVPKILRMPDSCHMTWQSLRLYFLHSNLPSAFIPGWVPGSVLPHTFHQLLCSTSNALVSPQDCGPLEKYDSALYRCLLSTECSTQQVLKSCL